MSEEEILVLRLKLIELSDKLAKRARLQQFGLDWHGEM
jgi:hypothetical protein